MELRLNYNDKLNEFVAIHYVGTPKNISNTDTKKRRKLESAIEKKMRSFLKNTDHKDIVRFVASIRTICRDFDEELLAIDKSPYSLRYINGKLVFYQDYLSNKDNKIYSRVKYDIFAKHDDDILSISTFGDVKCDINDYTKEAENSVKNIERLDNIGTIKLDEEMLKIIETYRIFFGKNPDFSDPFDLDIEIRTMICILRKYGINITNLEFYEKTYASNIKHNLALRAKIKDLKYVGELTEDIIDYKSDYITANKKIIELIGLEIRSSLSHITDRYQLIQAYDTINAYSNVKEERSIIYEGYVEKITGDTPFQKIKNKLENLDNKK